VFDKLLKQAGYTFLRIGGIKTGYVPTGSDLLLIAGYPVSRTKTPMKNGQVEIRSMPFILFTGQVKSNENRYNKDWHIFADN
jgi:hypothetical protein